MTVTNGSKLYRTTSGIVIEREGRHGWVEGQSWDDLVNREGLWEFLQTVPLGGESDNAAFSAVQKELLAPIESQELWACGVTYYSSRLARMEESKNAGGADFYARVYQAERPEIFFKAGPSRVAGPGTSLRIRSDSAWDVPEPELTLLVNRRAEIVGYTIGNDVSSRSIEGENPLYLPQAKTFERCAALGPGVLIRKDPMSPETHIAMRIQRGEVDVFSGETRLSEMKRSPRRLVEFLFRELEFPKGVFLMTGTGIVPDSNCTLHPGDRVVISIEGIGTLENIIERKRS